MTGANCRRAVSDRQRRLSDFPQILTNAFTAAQFENATTIHVGLVLKN
jgi:hypothetical protein